MTPIIKTMIRSSIIILATLIILPNLLRAETNITFETPRDGRVSLAIYDSNGCMVRVLLTGKPLAKGPHSLMWDGLDRYGTALPAGEYSWKLIETQGLRAEFITHLVPCDSPSPAPTPDSHSAPPA